MMIFSEGIGNCRQIAKVFRLLLPGSLLSQIHGTCKQITASQCETPRGRLGLPPYHPPICAVQGAFKMVMVAQMGGSRGVGQKGSPRDCKALGKRRGAFPPRVDPTTRIAEVQIHAYYMIRSSRFQEAFSHNDERLAAADLAGAPAVRPTS